MTTSSGEKGFCMRCSHPMNGHTAARDSKCKKCKRRIIICQANSHGTGNDTRGYRICFSPCNCGADFYPAKARAATLLQPHEHRVDHPGYRSLENESIDFYDEESTVAGASLGDDSGATTNERTRSSEAMQAHHKHPSDSSDDPIAIIDTTALLTTAEGKGKAKEGGQNVVQHDRSFSHESIDPISLAARHSVSDLTSSMAVASLGDSTGGGGPATQPYPDIGGGDASADGPLYVGVDNDGKHIRFRLSNGEKHKTKPESWEAFATEEGTYFLYTSKSGWQVWTDDITGHPMTSGSKGKEKGRKGGHGGSNWKKWFA